MAFAELEITAFTLKCTRNLGETGFWTLFFNKSCSPNLLVLLWTLPVLLRPLACINIFLWDGSSFPALMHQQERLDVYHSVLRRAESNIIDGRQKAQWTPESGITLSLSAAGFGSVCTEKSTLWVSQSSLCFPIPRWTTFIWVFKVRPRGKMNIKKCWYQVFHAKTHPGHGSKRLWHTCLINWEVYAWLTPPRQTSLIWQYKWL